MVLYKTYNIISYCWWIKETIITKKIDVIEISYNYNIKEIQNFLSWLTFLQSVIRISHSNFKKEINNYKMI